MPRGDVFRGGGGHGCVIWSVYRKNPKFPEFWQFHAGTSMTVLTFTLAVICCGAMSTLFPSRWGVRTFPRGRRCCCRFLSSPAGPGELTILTRLPCPHMLPLTCLPHAACAPTCLSCGWGGSRMLPVPRLQASGGAVVHRNSPWFFSRGSSLWQVCSSSTNHTSSRTCLLHLLLRPHSTCRCRCIHGGTGMLTRRRVERSQCRCEGSSGSGNRQSGQIIPPPPSACVSCMFRCVYTIPCELLYHRLDTLSQ